MNEEKYTRDNPKKSSNKRRVEPENKTTEKRHGNKLKNETSAGESYRKKLRYGKKDNSLTLEEKKKLQKMKNQGRKKIYKDKVVIDTIRKAGIPNEDDNVGTEALDHALGIAINSGIGVRKYAQDKKRANYAKKLHRRNKHLDEVQGAKGAKAAGEAGESTMSASAKESRKKLMQREFRETAAKKQATGAANSFGSMSKGLTDRAEDLMGRLAEWLKEFLADNPLVLIIALLILLVVLVVSGALSSCSMMVGGINNASVTTSFTAEDADIIQVEEDYVSLEEELQQKIENIEIDYPDYNEYLYSLAEISHNPFELAALLTVIYENYTPSQVESMLETIFDYQYSLTIQRIVETRTRTETRTGQRTIHHVDGTITSETYTYEVDVEYDYYILKTTLTNHGISAAVNALSLTEEQLERYSILLETRGNKPDIFLGNVYANPGVPEEYQNYAVPGAYLTNMQFSNMIREAEKYLGYPYVWGGSSPSTSFDCSGFVSYVINHCGNGWNYGRLTANGWKNATARVASSDVKPGDLVFFKGTYNTSGASHVGIVVDPVNKIMIHCGNPVQYASYDTAYWRAHAYCYGRIQ